MTMMQPSPPSPCACPTISFLQGYQEPVPFSRHAYSSRLANNVSGTGVPPISRITRAWRPCSSVAATRAGFTGVWPVQPSCVKPLSNGLGAPSLARSGPAPTTSANARRDAHTTQLCDPWPTNGFASCTAAGRPERPTMNPST